MGAELMETRTAALSPLEALQQAFMSSPSAEMAKQIADLQIQMERFRWEREERQARIDFDDAMNRVQSSLRRVAADMTNPQTHSRYASYTALDRVIRPEYTKEGFSVSFGEDEGSTPDYVTVLAYVRRSGIERIYRKGMPIDSKGPKGNDVMTKTHAAGSAGSYAKRYLLKDIFNLAIGEDDNDGNGAEPIEESRVVQLMDEMEDAPTLAELHQRWLKAAKEAKEANDSKAMAALTQVKDKAKAKLKGAE